MGGKRSWGIERELRAHVCFQREGRALLATYQTLGYLRGNEVVVLSPGQRAEQFHLSRSGNSQRPVEVDPAMRNLAIAYYQSASRLYDEGGLRDDPRAAAAVAPRPKP